MVSGKKIRYNDDGFDLDMTYVTPRLVAMSYPASGNIQTFYRNSCQQVAQMLKRNHGSKFMVINLSEQQYSDEQKDVFEHRYLQFSDWKDHHAPFLITLIKACSAMYNFLSKDPDNVIAINCNGGKGRTGTLICCYLLYIGFADSV